MSFEDNVEKLRVRFVSALKWIGLPICVDNASLLWFAQKCRERRTYTGISDEIVYLLSRTADTLVAVQSSEKNNYAYSDLINNLNKIDEILKLIPPQELDNICITLRQGVENNLYS